RPRHRGTPVHRTASILSVAARLAAIASLGLAATAAAQSAPVDYDIEAQPLADALNEFALQSDREILFAPEAVPERRTPGLRGRFSPEQALERLLAGTGLTWRETGNEAILIDAPDDSAPAPAPDEEE